MRWLISDVILFVLVVVLPLAVVLLVFVFVLPCVVMVPFVVVLPLVVAVPSGVFLTCVVACRVLAVLSHCRVSLLVFFFLFPALLLPCVLEQLLNL